VTCLICKTKFFHQTHSSPAESCDCGANCDALALREADEPVNLDVLRHVWETTCVRCLENEKRSVGRWVVDAYLCCDCEDEVKK